MVFKSICGLVRWTKVASAPEGSSNLKCVYFFREKDKKDSSLLLPCALVTSYHFHVYPAQILGLKEKNSIFHQEISLKT